MLCPAREPTPMSNTPNSDERGHFSAPRKAAAVPRGGSPELLSRELWSRPPPSPAGATIPWPTVRRDCAAERRPAAFGTCLGRGAGRGPAVAAETVQRAMTDRTPRLPVTLAGSAGLVQRGQSSGTQGEKP